MLKYRNEKSLNGFSLDVLKSAMQKYIRRGILDKALYAAIEMYFFECVNTDDENEKRIQKSIYTNFIHRLMITYLEDVGLGALNLWNEFDPIFDQLLSKKGNKKDNLKNIMKIIYGLTTSHHTRIPSHFNGIYNILFNADLDIRNNNRKLIKEYFEYFPLVKKIMDDIDQKSKVVDLKDPKTLQKLLYISIKNNSLDAFYWAKLIDENDEIPKKGRKKDEVSKVKLIFDTYSKALKENGIDIEEYIEMYKKWYLELYTLKERFLTYYILLIGLLVKIDWNEIKGQVIEFNDKKYKKLVTKNLIDEPIKFDDFVYDMHTRIGKNKGKDAEEFVKEGSKVVNDLNLFPEIKRFYDFSKLLTQKNKVNKEYLIEEKIEDEKKNEIVEEIESKIFNKESERFELVVRVQLVCSTFRQDTYFAKDKKTGQVVFVKGPFKNEEQADFAISVMNLRKDLGERFIQMEKVMLIPDLLESPLSQRNSCDKKKKYAFLVSENLCKEPFKTKMHSSKLWPETEVVDWEKMEKCRPFNAIEADDEIFFEYVKHLLFRKIIRVGDIADRNFLLVNEKDLYSVDEDAILKKDETLEVFKHIAKNRAEKVRNFIKKNKNKNSYIKLLEDWKKILKKNEEKELVKRLEEINLDDLDE